MDEYEHEDINKSSLPLIREENVEMKLRSIVKTLKSRTLRVKNMVEQPPTPTDVSEDEDDLEISKHARELILEDFTESRYASKKSLADDVEEADNNWKKKLKFSGYIDPRGSLNIGKFSFSITLKFVSVSTVFKILLKRLACCSNHVFHIQCLVHPFEAVLQTLPTI